MGASQWVGVQMTRAMRFECDSCHAKYKIADEKVRGRVVRFPCRKCNHKILIDGHAPDAERTVPAGSAYHAETVRRRPTEATARFAQEAPTSRSRRPSSPVRRRPPSVPPRRPSAVSRRLSSIPAAASSAFVGQHPGLAPALPMAPAGPRLAIAGEAPAWHVSINDVPVGPVRLEEMGHKIDAGAVSEYSLVWREGFDEWRPLATVPELMALLHERRYSGPPQRTSFSSMPPFVDSRTSISESSQLTVVAGPAYRASASGAPGEFAALADSLAPEGEPPWPLRDMSQPAAPIGPPSVFGSSPPLGSFSGLPAALGEGVSVPSAPPAAAAANAEPRRGLSLGVLALIFAVIFLTGVVAFLMYERFGDSVLDEWLGAGVSTRVDSARRGDATRKRAASGALRGPATAVSSEPATAVGTDPAATAPAGTEPSTGSDSDAAKVAESESGKRVPARATPATAAPRETTEAKLVFEPPNPANDGPTMAPAPRPTAKTRPTARSETVQEASDEGSLSAEEQKILDEFESSSDAAPAEIAVKKVVSSQAGNKSLDGDGVRATVTTNKPRLQRCYERAIRGQQSPESVRLDVSVTVAASGRVKDASADGNGPGGLAECVEASVRRWRFPRSSEGGPAKFPIVFSAN